MRSDLCEVRGGDTDKTNPKKQMKATMASIGEGSETSNIRDEVRIDEGGIRKHLDRLVKASAEEIQNNTGTRLRTNNALERMNRKIRKRTRVVGNFLD